MRRTRCVSRSRSGQGRGDAGDVDDVVGGRASREIQVGVREALDERPESGRSGQALCQLVGDVARVEVRERRDIALTMLFDAGRSFEERVLAEQFAS